MPNLHIYKSEKETCQAFAKWLEDLVTETLKKQDLFTIALSAAETPKMLYKILTSEYKSKIDWSKMHWFSTNSIIGTSKADSDSHAKALQNFLDHVPVSHDQVHLIPTDLTPDESARGYEEMLLPYFKGKMTTFDLVILGMDEYGNLLSLIPSATGLNQDNLVVSVYDEKEDLYKVTLTVSAIVASSAKAFLLTGKAKEEVVQRVLKGKYDPEKYPAQLINSVSKNLHWFLDEGAANKLINPVS